MHQFDDMPAHSGAPEQDGRARKRVGDCKPGDVVRVEGGDVYCVTAVIWGSPMGRKKVDTDYGWGELHVLDEKLVVDSVIKKG